MKVVVIGAGVIGLSSAYELARLGHAVTVIDAVGPGAGASHANAGWIVPAESGPVAAPGMVMQGLKWMLRRDSPLYVRPSLDPDFLRFMLAMARRCNAEDFRAGLRANIALSEHTLALLDGYRADGIDFEMHAHGLLMVFADPAAFVHHQHDLDVPAERGLAPEILTGGQVHDREPALSERLAGGIFFPHERHVRPDSLVSGLTDRARALGVCFLDRAPLGAVGRRGDTVTHVETDSATLDADAFLVAAGARSGQLTARFGTPLPVRPGKGYSVDFAPAPVQLDRIVNLCDAKVAVTPLNGTLRLAGTMEFAGWDTEVNPVRVAAIRRAPERYFTHWDNPEPSGPAWAGARPMTPDGMPIIGRLPSTANVYVATGHGMLGVTLGPATGALVARAIDSGTDLSELAAFRPDRFLRSARRRATG